LLWLKFIVSNAFRNLWRSPGRTLFSLIAIAAAAASLTLSQSFIDGVKRTFRHNIITSFYSQYQVVKKGYLENRGEEPFGYPVKDVDALIKDIKEKVGPLVFSSRRQRFHSLINFNEKSLSAVGMAIDAANEKQFLTMNEVIKGTHLGDAKPDSIFVGEGLASQLKLKPGDLISLVTNTAQGSLNAADLEVVGIFRTGVREIDNNLFYVHHDTAMKLLRIDEGSQLLLGFSGEDELVYFSKLKEVVARDYPELQVLHWHDLAGDMYDNSMGWIEGMFSVFRVIILAVATLSILNVFMISLLERTGEFGTLRAIGTYRSEIGTLILAESLLQSILGGIAGLLIAMVIIWLPLHNGIIMPPPPNMTASFQVLFRVPWAAMVTILLLCVGVAGGSGIYPAIKISRLNIVRALGRNI
jgi:putative ABC transport system permease protein